MQWQNLTLYVDFHDGENEYTGQCCVSVDKKQHAEVYAQIPFSNWDDEPSFDPEEDEESEPIFSADHLICFLAAANQCLSAGAVVRLEYWGSPYWFYHDLIHAEYDSGDGTDIYVDSDSERRALLLGAKLAAKNGVELSEIVRQLSAAEVEYRERFHCDSDALAKFMECCQYVNA